MIPRLNLLSNPSLHSHHASSQSTPSDTSSYIVNDDTRPYDGLVIMIIHAFPLANNHRHRGHDMFATWPPAKGALPNRTEKTDEVLSPHRSLSIYNFLLWSYYFAPSSCWSERLLTPHTITTSDFSHESSTTKSSAA